MPTCEIPDCPAPCRARGLCGKHYQRLKLKGNALAPSIREYQEPYDVLVRSGFIRAGECLLSKAKRAKDDYRRVSANGKRYPAHRVSYEKWHGPIPDGLVIDHTCHNEAAKAGECDGKSCFHRACVNPQHLRAVLQSVNMASSQIWQESLSWRKKITHCPRGHEYSEENTYHQPSGGRRCVTCIKESNRRSYQRKMAA